MKKVYGVLSILMLFATITINAAVTYPSVGGVWSYGVGPIGSYSEYMHPTRYHSSTVVASNGVGDKKFAPAGMWSQARVLYYSGCSFYYAIE